MATPLCHHPPPRPRPHAQHTLPRIRPLEFSGLYMEQEKSRDETEFLGVVGFYGALSAVGFDGV